MLELLIAAIFALEQHPELTERAEIRACKVTPLTGHEGLQSDTAGIPFVWVAENIGFYKNINPENESWILVDWMMSSRHHNNLNDNFTHFGLGRCYGTYVLILAR